MKSIDFYFDYISPFAYLLYKKLDRLPSETEINFIPVLFAGLLKHWGHLGPAEIDRKKLFTYQHATWLAARMNIPFRIPDTHPFVPLPYLRLTLAKDCDPQLISYLFDAIWTENTDPGNDAGRRQIFSQTGFDDAETVASDPRIKARLISNTQKAAEIGIFGVPTIVADGHLFWGFDSLEMLADYLSEPSILTSQTMQRLARI